MVLNRGGEGLQRGWYSMFLANHNVNQKPALCSQHCSQLKFYIERPQPSCSFHLCSFERRAFPWLRGEILSLAAPRSGERQQNNLLRPRAPRCWLQSGRGMATGRRTALAAAGAVSPFPTREPLGQPPTAVLRASFCRREVWWHRCVTPGFAPLERARRCGNNHPVPWARAGLLLPWTASGNRFSGFLVRKKITAAGWGLPSRAFSARLGLARVISCVPR